MNDFNIRAEDERLYTNSPDITNPLELLLQEIDMLFSIERTTILGQRDMGFSIEHLLWKTSFNSSYIESSIRNAIDKFCYSSKHFKLKIKVQLVRGTSKDIGIVDIHIFNKDGSIAATTQYVFR